MKIFLGSDHAGFKLKEEIKVMLKYMSVEFEDLTPEFDKDDDYPDSAFKVAKKVVSNNEKGILLCGTGIGMAIAANKVKGVRAGPCNTKRDALLSRGHNDLNILVLSGWHMRKRKAKKIIETFLNTKFDGGRHQRRIDKIKKIEKKYSK